jgi:hypothetical protein
MLDRECDQLSNSFVMLEPLVRNYELGSHFFSKINKDAPGIRIVRVLGVRLGDVPVKIPLLL